MERKQPPPPEDLALPKPWENPVITRAQWEHWRNRLMSYCLGDRPDGWWLYERNMQPPKPPYRQARILYEMNELAGPELQQCLSWWHDYYDSACESDEPRTKYWRWKDIPPALIKQWDRERRQALKKSGLSDILAKQ